MTVLDASAVLAFLQAEPGSDRVAAVLQASCISAANASECGAKIVARGGSASELFEQLRRHGVEIVPVNEADALFAAEIWPQARRHGLSLGDRLCLALGHRRAATVLTADRAWLQVDVGVTVRSIR